MRDRPEIVLTRHFFTSLFDFRFLSDEGAESLKRALRGSLAVAIALGLLLTRVFMVKYAMLSAGPVDDYARELLADHAFLMAVPVRFMAIPAIRFALSVPLDLRSNWVFRMTEDLPGRAEVAAANVRIVLALGVALPLALIGPVQWWVLGLSAAGIIALEALIFVPHMFVKGWCVCQLRHLREEGRASRYFGAGAGCAGVLPGGTTGPGGVGFGTVGIADGVLTGRGAGVPLTSDPGPR